MLRLYDFSCQCGAIFEKLIDHSQTHAFCDKCGLNAKKIISASGHYTANEDATWIKSCLEVVSKDDNSPHVVNFRKNPNRSTLKAWMKGQGVRHMDEGEKIPKREEVDLTAVNKEVWQAYRKRNALEVR